MGRVEAAQRVRIGVETSEGQILQFFCYIKQVWSDRLKLIFAQSKQQFAQYLQEGSVVRLSIYTPSGILLMESMVISAPVDCEFEVEYTKSSKHIQRRKYVRAQVNYRLILEQNGKTFTALSEDIGGGGIRFVCDSNLATAHVSGKLYIPDSTKSISFAGQIFVKPGFKQNEYLVTFDEISEDGRNKIIQKCLQLESIRIRKD